MTRKLPAGPKARAARVPETRRPVRPAKLRQMYEDDDDTFDIPDAALGGAKE